MPQLKTWNKGEVNMKKVKFEGTLEDVSYCVTGVGLYFTCYDNRGTFDKVFPLSNTRARITIEEIKDPRQTAPGKLKLAMA